MCALEAGLESSDMEAASEMPPWRCWEPQLAATLPSSAWLLVLLPLTLTTLTTQTTTDPPSQVSDCRN